MSRARRHAAPAATLFAGLILMLGGCGGTSSTPVARLSTAGGTGSASAQGGSSTASGTPSPEQAGVEYSKCMRANGVPSFPDPTAGGGLFRLPAGSDPSSPAFRTARAKCQKLMPGGGIGSGPPPSAQTLARFLKVAQCMRERGIDQFPDPTTSVPSNPFHGGDGVISDIEGVILVFPSTIDEQSPEFEQAARACAFPLHNH